MTFVPTNPEQLAIVAALLVLYKDGWVEPLVPPWRPFPILAQQVLATVLQTKGIARTLLVDRLSGNSAFSRITRNEIEELLTHLLSTDILAVADGTISFGHAGERRFGFRGFMDLASVFRTSKAVLVRYGAREIGTLDSWFIEQMLARDRSTFLLNGSAWNVVHWPGEDAILEVKPAHSAEAPLFLGGGIVLSYEVMQTVRRVLADTQELAKLAPIGTSVTPASEAILAELRRNAEAQRLDCPGSVMVAADGAWQWYTYAGLRANLLLLGVVLTKLDLSASVTNTSLRLRCKEVDTNAIRFSLQTLNDEVIHSILMDRDIKKSDVKFEDLLPTLQLAAFSQEINYDIPGALTIARAELRTCVVS